MGGRKGTLGFGGSTPRGERTPPGAVTRPWRDLPLTQNLRVQEQLALADRLFPVGCRITADAFALEYDRFDYSTGGCGTLGIAPALIVYPPQAASTYAADGEATLRHPPGPLPAPTAAQMCAEAHTNVRCALFPPLSYNERI